MRIRLRRDIDKLKKRIISLGALVEERFRLAARAVEFRDADPAGKVIDGDIDIDWLEVDIEEDCLKTIALHQGLAAQLRHILAMLKMTNDLERIRDLAVNIAERVRSSVGAGNTAIPSDYSTMFAKLVPCL